jgi:hypothetical protein
MLLVPKVIVCLHFDSLQWSTFCRFCHRYDATAVSWRMISLPWTFSVSLIHHCLSSTLTTGNYSSLYCVHNFGFLDIIALKSYSIAFSYCLLSLGNMHLTFTLSFHHLTVHFLLTLNNISLSGQNIVYFSIYLLKDILVISKFEKFWKKCWKHWYTGFCVNISIQLPWGDTEGCNCWVTRQEVYLAL